MNATKDLSNRLVGRSATATEQGIRWASRYFEYPATQLLDLRPNGPITSRAPFTGEPPPNLLVGYYYMAKTLNAYLFDQRTFSNFTYKLRYDMTTLRRGMTWEILTDCSYSIDTGAFGRALEEAEDITETVGSIQNAILMDRVLSSLNYDPIRGLGAVVQAQNANRRGAFEVRPNFAEGFRGSGVPISDAEVLSALCRSKRALINFSILSQKRNGETVLSLPLSDDWLLPFVEHFSTLTPERNNNIEEVRDFVTIMAPRKNDMTGGAITLKSGTRIGLPFRLRPRESGRAITAEMRRRRGRVVQRFRDRLPVSRRRRRPAANDTPLAEEESVEGDDIGSPEREAGPSDHSSELDEAGPSREDNQVENFNNEVIATVSRLIQSLEEELADFPGRVNIFFDFSDRLYGVLMQAMNENRLTQAFLLSWLLNFFIMEHLASTLYYLNERFVVNRTIFRNVGVTFAQVILRARDEQGLDLYTRIWSEREHEAFLTLYRRIATDFVTTTTMADSEQTFHAAEERDQLLEDMRFQETSGDVAEVINQISSHARLTHSVELSFRVKFAGAVAFSQNPIILDSFVATRRNAVNAWMRRQRLPRVVP